MIDDTAAPVSRRTLLRGALLIGSLAMIPYQRNAFAAAAPTNDFMRLSLLLTTRTVLNSEQGQRLFYALNAGDPKFAAGLQALQKAIAADHFSDMQQFAAFTQKHDPQIQATAMAIISGWYLGYTGDPVSHTANDPTRFVAFRDALMYQPTLDATVIPTYSRGHTNYWVKPPTTLADD
jgi:hypothetical protein